MRLLYLTARYPSAPGEAFLSAEAHALAALGVELHVVPCVRHLGPVPEGRWCDSNGEVVRIDPLGAWLRSLRHPLRVSRVIGTVLPSVLSERSKTALRGFARSSVAFSLAERFDGRVDHIHAHWADTPATIAMATAALLEVPWSFTAHRGDIVMGNDLARKTASAAFVHCISQQSRRMFLDRVSPFVPEAAGKVSVRHLGVAIPSLDSMIRPDETPIDELHIVCPAQLKPVKGHRYLIEAVAILRNRGCRFRLLVCGEGELESVLRRQASELKVDDIVEFLGDVAQSTLFAFYTSGRVRAMVLPSIDLGDNEHEGIPVSLIEAMAHGIPVVATSAGGVPELINSPELGTMVEPCDAVGLANALRSEERRVGKEC